MKWFTKAENETNSFLVDHPKTKQWSIWFGKFLLEALSAFIFAYGFRAFISPSVGCVAKWTDTAVENVTSINALISGGASGISQALIKFVEMFPGVHLLDFETTMVSILYFVINIPLFLLAWFKISKQFAAFTFINVVFVSIFNQIIPDSWVYNVVNLYDDNLARAIFGAITTGISSGMALMVGTSSGGVDIISMYISERKSSSVGQYSVIANCITVTCYVVFSVIGLSSNPAAGNTDRDTRRTEIITMALYTLVYFFVSGRVIDILNTKNKKQELQIFTTNENLPTVLIRAFPHSCTVVDSKGAFSGRKNLMVYMVISRSEKKKAIKLIRSVDRLSFITVQDLNQVYGRFYIKPIE